MGLEGKEGDRDGGAMPDSFLNRTTFHEPTPPPQFLKKKKSDTISCLVPIFPVSWQVIAGLNAVLNSIKPFPAQFPTSPLVSILAHTQYCFLHLYRSRQAILPQWRLPPGTGPRAGIPKVISRGEEEPEEGLPTSYQRG